MFFVCFETGFLCIALVVLDFVDQAGLELTAFCLPLGAGLTGVHPHTRLTCLLKVLRGTSLCVVAPSAG